MLLLLVHRCCWRRSDATAKQLIAIDILNDNDKHN